MPAHRVITDEILQKARVLMEGQGLSQRQAASLLCVSQPALSRALRRADAQAGEGPRVTLDEPDVTVDGDEGAFHVDGDAPIENMPRLHQLMREHGFDPADWEPVRGSLTRWGWNKDLGEPYKRTRIDVKRRLSLLALWPAEHGAVPPIAAVPLATERGTEPRLGVIFSDQHAPYHDPALHQKACAFLNEVQPEFGILAGDTLDFPTPSRHRPNPKFHATPQECVNAAYRVLRDYREAHPPTTWRKLLGNHDMRLRHFLLETAPDLATLHPANTGGTIEDLTPVMAIRRLLHLDALGITCHEPVGEYGDEMIVVCDNLGVIHGERSGKGAAAAQLAQFGHSIASGHLHTAGMLFKTAWDMDGPSTHVAVNVPTMARIEHGLGYTRRPDWQQGFATVNVWPDGTFAAELALFLNGVLVWRDERW